MTDADTLLGALLAQSDARGSLALVTTGSLGKMGETLSMLAQRHGLVMVDLSCTSAPLDLDPALGPRRLLCGLSCLRPEARRATAMSLNRARDRVSALSLKVVLWLLEEDYRWFCREAPDFANRLQEVLSLSEEPQREASATQLVTPLGGAPSPEPPPPSLSGWLSSVLSVPGAWAAIPGPNQLGQARGALEKVLASAGGPAAWLRLDLWDPVRAARWVAERPELRVIVAQAGLPPPGLPPRVASLVCGLPEAAIPQDIARPPAPGALSQMVSSVAGDDAVLQLSSNVFELGSPNIELMDEEREARSYLVVAPSSRTADSSGSRAANGDLSRDSLTWRLSVESPEFDEHGRARSWLMVTGDGALAAPMAHRKQWVLDEEPAVDALETLWEEMFGAVPAARLPDRLIIDVAGADLAAMRFRDLNWERWEQVAPRPLAIGRTGPRQTVGHMEGDRALLFVSRPGLARQAHADPWFLWEGIRSQMETHGRFVDLSVCVDGSLESLTEAVRSQIAAQGGLDLLILDAPAAWDTNGRIAGLLFESNPSDPSQRVDGERPAIRVDAGGLVWALRGLPVGVVLVAGWDAGVEAPTEHRGFYETLIEATTVGVIGPTSRQPHDLLYAAHAEIVANLGVGLDLVLAAAAARLRAGEAVVVAYGEGALRPGTRPQPTATCEMTRTLPEDPVGGLVGRRMEMLYAIRGLSHLAVLSITGLAGQGKTMFAAGVARLWAGLGPGRRVVWSTLGRSATPEDLVHTLEVELGVQGGAADPLQALVTALAARPTLLVLDAVEHVIYRLDGDLAPAWTDLFARLADMGASNGLRLLLAGRVMLLPPGESRFVILGGLAGPDGRELLRRRLVWLGAAAEEAVHLTMGVGEDSLSHPASVVGVARILGGEPHELVERQQMRSLDVSLALLPEDIRSQLSGLSAFHRVAPLAALAGVCGVTGPRAGEIVGALFSVGLAEIVGGIPILHPALPSALGAPALAAVQRWAEQLLQLCDALPRVYQANPGTALAMARVCAEDVLRAAQVFSRASDEDTQGRVTLALDNLLSYLDLGGDAVWAPRVDSALRAAMAGAPPAIRLDVELSALERALNSWDLGAAWARSATLLRSARRLARNRTRNRHLLLRALRQRSNAARLSGAIDEARVAIAEAWREWEGWSQRDRPLGQRWRAFLLESSAILLAADGQPARALALLDELGGLAQELGHVPLQRSVAQKRASWGGEDDDASLRDLREEADRLEREGTPSHGVRMLRSLGQRQQNMGRLEEARDSFERAIEWARRAGLTADAAVATRLLGGLALLGKDFARAERLLREAEEALRKPGHETERATCLSHLAELWLNVGQPEAAANAAQMALPLLSESSEQRWKVAWNGSCALAQCGRRGDASAMQRAAINAYARWRSRGNQPFSDAARNLALAWSPAFAVDMSTRSVVADLALDMPLSDHDGMDSPDPELLLERNLQASWRAGPPDL